MKYFLVLSLFWNTAFAVTPRELALSHFPGELRDILGAPPEQVKRQLNALKVRSKMEDRETIFLNVYGVDFDVTLGKKGNEIVWMGRQAIHDQKLYGKLTKLLSGDEKKLWKGGTLDLPKHGVLFRFTEKRAPLSVVIKKLP